VVDTNIDLEPIARLTRDLKTASVTLGDDEARFLVDAYYIMQEDRKRYYAQDRTLEKSAEPNEVIKWFAKQSETLEKQIQRALDAYASHHVMGKWLYSIYGIGPVISAGLVAHIDIHRSPTVGHIFSFGGIAGKSTEPVKEKQRAIYRAIYEKEFDTTRQTLPELDMADGYKATYLYPDNDEKKGLYAALFQVVVEGNVKPKPQRGRPYFLDCEFKEYRVFSGSKPWLKGEKRPFNADLKTLFWKVGQSFMKFSNEPACYFGHLYRQRKDYEVTNNEMGALAHIAAERVDTVGKDTDAYAYYSTGKLPPAHVDGRARRFAVKMFLSDFHAVWYYLTFNRPPPRPYVIDHLGHTHWRAPHNIEEVPGMMEAYKKIQPIVKE
jgi:hypothetical protein